MDGQLNQCKETEADCARGLLREMSLSIPAPCLKVPREWSLSTRVAHYNKTKTGKLRWLEPRPHTPRLRV